ncbi:MAG: chalcone isomerase family protein [Sterolibacteriaceae bacterium]|uniref:Chalcone isomerase family protein n=1 Tax=Candidatus Methylophosphatis roskildensis TaxID=2899263 RepID=A0A9D7E6L0_9PROT|nr:chalcone isomerase family protein [Candidatus Methylophosphatis roskildensis]MBK7238527.1 chalcone isomerase family protein [Sterolibacteriaceae bacterium]
MKSVLRLLAIAACLIAAPAFAAAEVAGIKFEDTEQVAGQATVLNGAGLRTRLFFQVYAMGLYLPKKEASAAAAIGASGAKRVHIVTLRDLTAEQFAEALVKGFAENHDAAEMAKLQARLDEFKATLLSIGAAKKGTQISIDFVPGSGTRLLVGSNQKGKDIAGEDFYAGLLRIWLGSKPVDADLKAALFKAG